MENSNTKISKTNKTQIMSLLSLCISIVFSEFIHDLKIPHILKEVQKSAIFYDICTSYPFMVIAMQTMQN